MTPERFQRLREVLDRRQPDLTVVTEQVHKNHNLSAILRTCDAVGIHEAHFAVPQGRYRAGKGTAAGSQKWVKMHRYAAVADAITPLKQQGYKVYAAHLSERAVDYRGIDYTQPMALLLGAEKHGVSDAAAAMADGDVVIPMVGMVGSYNVSVAAAIILAEAQRQRQAAGLYEYQRLDDQEYQQTFFRWAHPIVTRYCDHHDLEYPPVDEEGEIIEPARWYRMIREQRKQKS